MVGCWDYCVYFILCCSYYYLITVVQDGYVNFYDVQTPSQVEPVARFKLHNGEPKYYQRRTSLINSRCCVHGDISSTRASSVDSVRLKGL